MRVVLLKEIRTELGIYTVGTPMPATPAGDGGWLIELAPFNRNSRRKMRRIDRTAARPMVGLHWRLDAACNGRDPEWWFPGPADRGTAAKAKRVCDTCPVATECATDALQSGEHHGIRASVHCRSPHAADQLAHIAGIDPTTRGTDHGVSLEVRRQRVSALSAQGLTAVEIAQHLGVDARTIQRDRAVVREAS